MKVTVIEVDDWIGLYKDGQLVAEGHRLEPKEVLVALGIDCKHKWYEGELDSGTFPESLSELEIDA